MRLLDPHKNGRVAACRVTGLEVSCVDAPLQLTVAGAEIKRSVFRLPDFRTEKST